MGRFIYFLPGIHNPPTIAQIRAAGLGYAFPQASARVECGAGPGGLSGHLIAYGGGEALEYQPQKQSWVRMSDKAWVGMWKDDPPKPLELQRYETLDGNAVELGDGNLWVIPVLRFMNGNTNLPSVLTVVDGYPKYVVKTEFKAAFAFALEVQGKCCAGQGASITAAEHMFLAAEALKVNYRVGEWELSLLELINNKNVTAVADAALDGPNFVKLMEEFKKKLQGASTPGHGSAAGASA